MGEVKKDFHFQCLIFLLGLLFFSGTFAKEWEHGRSRLSPRSAFVLRISALEDNPKNKKPRVDQFEKESTIYNKERRTPHHRILYPLTESESLDTMRQMDVVTPMTTVPTINPTTPTTTTPVYNPLPTPSVTTPTTNPVTNPYTTPYTNPVTNPATNPVTNPNPTPTPTTTTPTSSSGQSWCVASPSASQTQLQVALDYACGYGGADCSGIQQGGSCFNPDTIRDHASYAFNQYYQKNPVPTSCDFSGTAIVTNTDPSTTSCRFPSASTSSSTLNTTSPTGSGYGSSSPPAFGSSPPTFGTSPPDFGSSPPAFGTSPPDYGGSISDSKSISIPPPITLICFLISLVYLKVFK